LSFPVRSTAAAWSGASLVRIAWPCPDFSISFERCESPPAVAPEAESARRAWMTEPSSRHGGAFTRAPQVQRDELAHARGSWLLRSGSAQLPSAGIAPAPWRGRAMSSGRLPRSRHAGNVMVWTGRALTGDLAGRGLRRAAAALRPARPVTGAATATTHFAEPAASALARPPAAVEGVRRDVRIAAACDAPRLASAVLRLAFRHPPPGGCGVAGARRVEPCCGGGAAQRDRRRLDRGDSARRPRPPPV